MWGLGVFVGLCEWGTVREYDVSMGVDGSGLRFFFRSYFFGVDLGCLCPLYISVLM